MQIVKIAKNIALLVQKVQKKCKMSFFNDGGDNWKNVWEELCIKHKVYEKSAKKVQNV